MPGLGKKPFRPDPRDWHVEKLKALIAEKKAVPLAWDVPSILDQGNTGHCVGFGTAGACNTDDENHVASGLDNDAAHALYYATKIIEGDPGGEDGAYVRDGLKAARNAGYISAYSLLRTRAELVEWLENHGPVVVGSEWLSGMDSPDSNGFVHPTGFVRGGHCYFARGDRLGIDFVNSWGKGWGKDGMFYISSNDVDMLMTKDWEAWAVVQDPTVPVPEPTPEPTPEPSLFGKLLALLKRVLEAISAFIRNLTGGGD